MIRPEFVELSPAERSRKYTFSGGDVVELKAVKRLAVSASGTHRVETEDGAKHIIPTGWIHIQIDVDDWTL